MLLSMFIEQEDFFLGMGAITIFTLFFILAPVQWFIFKRLARNNEELFVLKKELGQTEANMDLLRSQINPHFLFNALNTLYGLAIHEKAERTSEAIEKLGSMMRFMLQENVQEKISLVRDLEYLNNYIALQRLRTDINPNIKIQIAIQQEVNTTVQIAPMLLIPFIENAFKHGISLREESHIRISLEIKNNTLYFDVFNTKHVRSENDPEKNSNGIGFLNVKQRLQLIYPGKHELVIRETTHDYFVHLVINLG
jgi:two-component system, LytTR family, sensor kinase